MVFDKDAFLQDHWNEFCQVSQKISYRLHCKFKSICSEDLYECAVYGVLKAYLNMDMQDSTWHRDLYQYGYHHAHIEVIKMHEWMSRQSQVGSSRSATSHINDDTCGKHNMKLWMYMLGQTGIFPPTLW